ncbi:MAG TPA: hypothetical protein ENJ10_09195 [Caldithrix abyssi]|uniref:Uncharacterized protein n=1 Tax=Caldithrix abyssi TaxID=187145 RepID=A0A7V1LMP5_CALAY|nr:hypothetical protein [Caldithrix abyssi]
MAKKQTFGDKVNKSQGESAKAVKIVFTFTSPKNGQMKFAEKIVKIFPGDNEDQKINTEIKNGRALLEARV